VSEQSQTTLNGLARTLVAQNIVSEEHALEALEASEDGKVSFLSELSSLSDVKSSTIAQVLAADFGLPAFDLNSIDIDGIPKEFVKEELIEAHAAVPIAARGSKLFVAISDPTNSEPLDKYKFTSGLSVEAIIVADSALQDLRSRVADQSGALSGDLDESFDLDVDNSEAEEADDGDSDIEDTPKKYSVFDFV